MASPCEVHVDTLEADVAAQIGAIAEAEAIRIERKFSRYRDDSVISALNSSNGRAIPVDAETAGLLDYAAQCFTLSDGLFDITSGALRRIWRFDGSDRVPTEEAVSEILPFIGWAKVDWTGSSLTLPPGMELDFGGLGKEYAVDAALNLATATRSVPILLNFGGDLRVSGLRSAGRSWRVAIESVDDASKSEGVIEIVDGALTTSGDARRFLLKDGRRYSHILDPRTGWPVHNPPRSVTVAAPTCMEAGLLSTLAMLQGEGAEAFLEREHIHAWWIR